MAAPIKLSKAIDGMLNETLTEAILSILKIVENDMRYVKRQLSVLTEGLPREVELTKLHWDRLAPSDAERMAHFLENIIPVLKVLNDLPPAQYRTVIEMAKTNLTKGYRHG